jgi:dienelactone hydrolase
MAERNLRRWIWWALVAGVAACARQPRGPAVFDLAAARRADDLEVTTGPVSTPVAPRMRGLEVSYLSHQWDDAGRAVPIRIRGFLAARAALAPPRRVPAVIVAHGLGAKADLDVAVEVARNLDVVALAISAPGLGGSQGRPVTFQDAAPLFAGGGDVRQSWLYAYVHALLRAVTLVAARPDVDAGNIVITGTSMGGIACFIAGGADDRVRGILPVNASGGLAQAAAAGSWLATLVNAARDRGARPEGIEAVLSALDPLAFAPRQHGVVYMLDGAQDEFFPLPQVLATYAAVRAPAKSLALLADYDHEWYFAAGCPARCMPGAAIDPGLVAAPAACPPGCPTGCPAPARWPYCGKQASYNRHAEATARWSQLLRALVATTGAGPPRAPLVERREHEVVVQVEGPRPRAVRLAVSDNGGYTYGQFRLNPGPDGTYRFAAPLPATAIVFAEVEAEDGTVATSAPELPPGFRAPIRPFGPP